MFRIYRDFSFSDSCKTKWTLLEKGIKKVNTGALLPIVVSHLWTCCFWCYSKLLWIYTFKDTNGKDFGTKLDQRSSDLLYWYCFTTGGYQLKLIKMTRNKISHTVSLYLHIYTYIFLLACYLFTLKEYDFGQTSDHYMYGTKLLCSRCRTVSLLY